jgi:hypothetical protein
MTNEKPERAPSEDAAKDLRALAEKLKAGTLDLGVEDVEERIAPSETNVFDK